MSSVHLDDEDWQRVLYVLWNATGVGISCGVTHPLVMKIGEQLRLQATGNSKMQEVPAAEAQLAAKGAH